MAAGTNSKPPFIPEFLAKLGIKPGEWMFTSKLTVKAFMRPNWPLKARIWACLMLQSFGFEGDLAVAMVKGRDGDSPRIGPIMPKGIASMLNKAAVEAFKESRIPLTDEERADVQITRQNMRAALSEMEDDGLIVRVRVDGSWQGLKGKSLGEALESGAAVELVDLPAAERKKLQNGRAAVYLLAKPRPAKSLEITRTRYTGTASAAGSSTVVEIDHYVQMLFIFAPGLKRDPERAAELAKREDVRREAQLYDCARAAAKARFSGFLEPLINGTSTNLPVVNSHYSPPPISNKPQDRISTDRQKSTPDQGRQDGIPAPERDRAGRPAPPPVSAANSNGRGAPGSQTKESPQPSPAAAADSISPTDTAQVLEAMRRYVRADDHAAEQFIRACRAYAPACTAPQMCEAIKAKGQMAKAKDNPTGFLMVAAARLLKTEAQQPEAGEVIVGPFSDDVRRKGAAAAKPLDEMLADYDEFKQRKGGRR